MTAGIQAVTPSVNAWNAEYLDGQYARFRDNPDSVAPDVRAFFHGFELALAQAGPLAAASASSRPAPGTDDVRFELGVYALVDAYRRLGHLVAALDPLGRPRAWRGRDPNPPELTPEFHGLSERDLARECSPGIPGLPARVKLADAINALRRAYCGSMGVEHMHVVDRAAREWLIERVERLASAPKYGLAPQDRAFIAQQLVRCEQFERFLQLRYMGEKRFSAEGGETAVPLLERALETLAQSGVEEVVIGMAHRGRLNVLNNILDKAYEQLLTEFEESWTADFEHNGGDVKYHRGHSALRTLRTGKQIAVSLSPNPSHLEAVNGVVMGRARGKQRLRDDTEQRRRVVPILIHGDAAVMGQGSVTEVLNFEQLAGYSVGGTLHVVINNQLGFTTVPLDGRSTEYCTDCGKIINAPVLHVNAADADACVAAAQIAAEFRQTFARDIFIDLCCFRKYGHNETDEPTFTQPVMYEQIKAHPGVVNTYIQQVISEGVVDQATIDQLRAQAQQELNEAQARVKAQPENPGIPPGRGLWEGVEQAFSFEPIPTGVPMDTLREICAALSRVPEGFSINPKVEKILADRGALCEKGEITYADAEHLAFASLLLEGHAIRLSGQDVRRGTFSHRHAVLRDARSSEPYVPLNSIRQLAARALDAGKPGMDGRPTQARFEVFDSPLSELGVMSFDYGVSLTDPRMLVCWEAQFGDFVNGAQMLIDQFLSSSEVKWGRWSGLTLLLPHGQEGAGPEHSSCRFERFLQLCGSDNMQVVYPSTAAQAFHMFRRQVHAPWRKPLIVMTPKSLLRVVTSTIDELVSGHFQTALDDPRLGKAADRRKVRRVIYCTGKIYHELATRRDATKHADIALVRIEQLYPFDVERIREIDKGYPASAARVWVQEEQRNQGAYLFVADHFRQHLGVELGYIGRETHASPAAGSKGKTKKVQESIIARGIEAGEPAPQDHAAAPVAASKNGKLDGARDSKSGANGAAQHAAPLPPSDTPTPPVPPAGGRADDKLTG